MIATEDDIERLKLILGLTRDLGVNLAGVRVILNMREKMEQMQQEFNRFFQYMQEYVANASSQQSAVKLIVPLRRTSITIRSVNKRASEINVGHAACHCPFPFFPDLAKPLHSCYRLRAWITKQQSRSNQMHEGYFHENTPPLFHHSQP
ncbi:MAG: chaperone modulator CbpM [Blastocatellia bacterium]